MGGPDGDYLDGGAGDDYLYSGGGCFSSWESSPGAMIEMMTSSALNEVFGRAGNDFWPANEAMIASTEAPASMPAPAAITTGASTGSPHSNAPTNATAPRMAPPFYAERPSASGQPMTVRTPADQEVWTPLAGGVWARQVAVSRA